MRGKGQQVIPIPYLRFNFEGDVNMLKEVHLHLHIDRKERPEIFRDICCTIRCRITGTYRLWPQLESRRVQQFYLGIRLELANSSNSSNVLVEGFNATLSGPTPSFAEPGWPAAVQLLDKQKRTKLNDESLPIIIAPGADRLVRVSFVLNCYTKGRLGKKVSQVFKRSDIKQPDTCRALYTVCDLKIRTDAGEINAKFRPFLYIGDVIRVK